MTYHYKSTGLASVAALALGATFTFAASTATAATVDVLDFSTNLGGNQADVFASDYGAFTPVGASWSDDPTWVVPPADEGGISRSPFSNTGLAGTRDYFSVIGTGAPGEGGGAESPVTLTFTEAQSSFRLLWGSIDTYNEITFSDGGGNSVTVTGTNVAGAASGLSAGGGMVALVNIFDFEDPAGGAFNFTTATFSSINGDNSFEFATDISPDELTAVPLPASALLLLGGLGGLGGLSALRRRKRAA